MSFRHFFTILSACVLTPNSWGYTIDAIALGNALGYPGDQLVVADATQAQRKLNALSVERENVGLRARIDPDRILASIRITGKTKQTFYPILITVAKKGTFLSPEFMNLVDKLDAIPPDVRKAQGMEYLGRLRIDKLGAGGCVIADIRIPSNVNEITQPSFGAAAITELRLERDDFDLRIAMFLTLDEGGRAPLLKVAGGEVYHATFNSSGAFEDTAPANVSKTLDKTHALTALNVEAQRALKASTLFSRASSSDTAQSSNAHVVNEHKSMPWSLVVILIAAAFGLLWLKLKRRS